MKPLRNPHLQFNEKKHTYSLKGKRGLKLTSATSWIKSFNPPFKPFDEEGIALHLEKNAKQNSKYYGKTAKQILRKWRRIAKKGTLVHKEIEDYICLGEEPKHPLAQAALTEIDAIRSLEPTRIIPELRIVSEELGIAGTIDLLIEYEAGMVCLVDWKTNETLYGAVNSLDKEHYSQLNDDHITRYALQLSLYAYILETCYDREVVALNLIHLTPLGARVHTVPYMKKHIIQMIESAKK